MPTYDSYIHKQELYSPVVVYGVGLNTCPSRDVKATTYIGTRQAKLPEM